MKCEYCGREFDQTILIGKYPSGRFCSITCARGFSTKNEVEYTKTTTCKKCGKEIQVNKRASIYNCLCDRCRKAYTYIRKNPTKEYSKRQIYKKVSKVKPPCINCGKPIKKGATSFCSSECVVEFRWKKIVSEIELTGSFLGNIYNKKPKKYLMWKFGHQCSICGNTEWQEKPIPLVLDHVDGNPDNWNTENCRLVCGNCDMQLPTYKSKNKNSWDSQRAKKRRSYIEIHTGALR